MAGSPLYKNIIRVATGPLYWIASVGHWVLWHFDPKKFKPNQRPAVQRSIAAVAAFGVFGLLPLLYFGGPVAFVKYWLLPWIGFHFGMSTCVGGPGRAGGGGGHTGSRIFGFYIRYGGGEWADV